MGGGGGVHTHTHTPLGPLPELHQWLHVCHCHRTVCVACGLCWDTHTHREQHAYQHACPHSDLCAHAHTCARIHMCRCVYAQAYPCLHISTMLGGLALPAPVLRGQEVMQGHKAHVPKGMTAHRRGQAGNGGGGDRMGKAQGALGVPYVPITPLRADAGGSRSSSRGTTWGMLSHAPPPPHHLPPPTVT